MTTEPRKFPVRKTIESLLVLLTLIAVALPAVAMQRGPISLDVLVDGRALREYPARGTNYVEAREGREYALRVRNHTGERIAVALSVDGLNTIDARATSARDASRWILQPYQTITIKGWQTSTGTARRFFFTTEDRSYGAWLGETANLGVISAAAFRERRPLPMPIERPKDGDDEFRGGRRQESAPSEVPSAGTADRSSSSTERKRSEEAGAVGESEALSDSLAATGIGREVGHRVRHVRFDAETDPAAVLEIRYEYHDALVRLGVLPDFEDPLARRERSRGFRAPGFSPDPYR